nr:hypothetical protein [Anaerolineae bacterium]
MGLEGVLTRQDIQFSLLLDMTFDSEDVLELARPAMNLVNVQERQIGLKVDARPRGIPLAGSLGAEFLPDQSGKLLILAAFSAEDLPDDMGAVFQGISRNVAEMLLQTVIDLPELDELGSGVLIYDRAEIVVDHTSRELIDWLAKNLVCLLAAGIDTPDDMIDSLFSQPAERSPQPESESIDPDGPDILHEMKTVSVEDILNAEPGWLSEEAMSQYGLDWLEDGEEQGDDDTRDMPLQVVEVPVFTEGDRGEPADDPGDVQRVPGEKEDEETADLALRDVEVAQEAWLAEIEEKVAHEWEEEDKTAEIDVGRFLELNEEMPVYEQVELSFPPDWFDNGQEDGEGDVKAAEETRTGLQFAQSDTGHDIQRVLPGTEPLSDLDVEEILSTLRGSGRPDSLPPTEIDEEPVFHDPELSTDPVMDHTSPDPGEDGIDWWADFEEILEAGTAKPFPEEEHEPELELESAPPEEESRIEFEPSYQLLPSQQVLETWDQAVLSEVPGKEEDIERYTYPPPVKGKLRKEESLNFHVCAACGRYSAHRVESNRYKCYLCGALVEYSTSTRGCGQE